MSETTDANYPQPAGTMRQRFGNVVPTEAFEKFGNGVPAAK